MNVDTIQEGARDFSLVLADLLGGASAGLMRIAVIAAWTEGFMAATSMNRDG
jgi:hypothetical protein